MGNGGRYALPQTRKKARAGADRVTLVRTSGCPIAGKCPSMGAERPPFDSSDLTESGSSSRLVPHFICPRSWIATARSGAAHVRPHWLETLAHPSIGAEETGLRGGQSKTHFRRHLLDRQAGNRVKLEHLAQSFRKAGGCVSEGRGYFPAERGRL